MTSLIRCFKMLSLGGLFLGCAAMAADGVIADVLQEAQKSSLGNISLNCICLSPDGVADLLDRSALQVPNPEKNVLLDITAAGKRLVAVGERGIVVFSEDKGQTWRQAKVPTSVSLTAVTFPSRNLGWAVGHAGVVLHTKDGGDTWVRQLHGGTAARLALDAARRHMERLGPDDPMAKRHVADAQQLIDDGADKPFLDLYFKNEKEGIIVGAYGLIFHTEDGGQTWQSWMPRIDNKRGFHYYTVQVVRDIIYLAGEQGLFFRSTDAGKNFQKIETRYQGSYFTSVVLNSGELLIGGLKGNVFWSINQGETFTPVDVPIPVSILTCCAAKDGSLFFVNQAGHVLKYCGGQKHRLQVIEMPKVGAIMASLIQLNDGVLLGVGNKGFLRISLPNVN